MKVEHSRRGTHSSGRKPRRRGNRRSFAKTRRQRFNGEGAKRPLIKRRLGLRRRRGQGKQTK